MSADEDTATLWDGWSPPPICPCGKVTTAATLRHEGAVVTRLEIEHDRGVTRCVFVGDAAARLLVRDH